MPADDPLADAPVTRNRRDEGTLKEARQWVHEGHPGECWERLEALEASRTDYEVLHGVLLAHVIREHAHEAERLARLPEGRYVHWREELGIDEAVRDRAEQLERALTENMRDFGTPPAGPILANLVAVHLPARAFERVWEAAWSADATGPLLTKLMWASNAHDEFEEERRRFLEEELPNIVSRVGLRSTVEYIARAPVDKELRTALLARLLDKHGDETALLLARRDLRPTEPAGATLRAYRMLRGRGLHELEAQGALEGAVQVDADAVADDVATLVNDDGRTLEGGERFHMERWLEWEIQEAMTPSLLSTVAREALSRNPVLHDLLAGRVHLLRTPEGCVREWVESTLRDPEALAYNAGLLRRYVSDPRDPDQLEPLVDLAFDLYSVHGTVDEDQVYREWNVQGQSRQHRATALMRELSNGRGGPDVDAILETLEEYPATRQVLGDDFPSWLRDQPRDFVAPWPYEVRAGDLYDDILDGGRVGVDDVLGIAHTHRRIEEALYYRARWEARFRLLRENGITPDADGLRTRESAWQEAMVGARLLEAGFEIQREPEEALPDGPDPDYLVVHPDTGEEFFLELRKLGRRPEEVFDKVHTGLGGAPKKSLQNKLTKQWGNGRVDPERPLVIGLEVPRRMELEYSLPNSLYGVFQVSMATRDGQTVWEGVSRDEETYVGLFHEDRARYLSGVLAFRHEQATDEHLDGQMFWPPGKPPHPLSLPTYRRLRDALLGEAPDVFVAHMRNIPTVTTEEARALVEAGIEQPRLLVDDLHNIDDTPLPPERMEELAGEVRWLARIHRHGRVRDLKSAREVNLDPLETAGIRTLPQLLRAEEKPEGLPEGVWHALRAEANKWSSLRPGTASGTTSGG